MRLKFSYEEKELSCGNFQYDIFKDGEKVGDIVGEELTYDQLQEMISFYIDKECEFCKKHGSQACTSMGNTGEVDCRWV